VPECGQRSGSSAIEGLARIIEHQVDLAQYFYDRLKGISHIELAPRSPTNVVCFRFSPSGIDKRKHDDWQTEFHRRLEVALGCWFTTTTIAGKKYLRINLLHYDLQTKHVDAIIGGIEAICRSRHPH
jgi:glutamate/tyrosine decarboxylase-like PLP-dependent enzyme